MRTVVVSDFHFGDPHGGDILRHPWARSAFFQHLEGADRLILLGDVFEFTFQHMVTAIDAARPFFCELSASFEGLKVLFMPGNHDHHLVALAADERRERQALGLVERDEFKVAPAERILKRLAPNIRARSAYPLLIEGDIAFHHGHYLATHLDQLGWRAFDRLQWWIWQQDRRRQDLGAADYEALLSPLHELCYQVAQLPEGVKAQKEIEAMLARLAALAKLPAKVTDGIGHLGRVVRDRRRREDLQQPPHQIIPWQDSVEALSKVAANLGIAPGTTVICGHTHVPHLSHQGGDYSFANTGSWFVDHRERHKPGYWDDAWPGSVIDVVDGHLSLHRLLDLEQVRSAHR